MVLHTSLPRSREGCLPITAVKVWLGFVSLPYCTQSTVSLYIVLHKPSGQRALAREICNLWERSESMFCVFWWDNFAVVKRIPRFCGTEMLVLEGHASPPYASCDISFGLLKEVETHFKRRNP